jgi:GT2 family glycosyltransferase
MSALDSPAGVVTECDVSTGIPAIEAPRPGIRALVLVRVFSEPIGMLDTTLPGGGLSRAELARLIVRELGPELRQRLEDCGLTLTEPLPADGLRPPRTPRFLETRERVLREGPEVTAAVCTRDRPEGLGALLVSLRAQEYERVRVLVVDNAPSDDRTRRLVSELAREHDIEYVEEPRPGLSWARNRAVEASETEVVAWADDDEVCDRWWAAELARGFVEVPNAGAVTGMVIPSELETPSQMWFERYSGVSRSRGFSRAVFSAETAHLQSPLYPLPPFGVGGNMAFRRDAIERIGGFDRALGPGTLSMDGDDTAALSSLLLAGGTIVYQPTAIVHHRHRRDYAVLRHLLLGYGRGLGAYYTSMLVHQPSCALELLRLTPRALRDQFSARGRRSSELEEDFPRELLRNQRLGLLQGPLVYARARVHARRLGAPSRTS